MTEAPKRWDNKNRKPEPHLGGLHSSRLLLAGQLVLQIFDLSLQQLNDLLVVLFGTADLPLAHLGLGRLQTALQTDVLLHRQTGFLGTTANSSVQRAEYALIKKKKGMLECNVF